MSRKSLTLTIVIPVYNEQRHLGACLEAIAQQTVAPNAVLVVDNNSTDKSLAVAKGYSFVKILHEKRQGVVFARDTGFNAVKTELIGRIDADTILPHDWVARVQAFYASSANHQLALTGGGYFYNIRWPRFNGWVQSQLAYRWNRLIIGHYIVWGSNMALPTTTWQQAKLHACQDNALHEDMDLAIHLHRQGFEVHYDPTLRVGVYLKQLWENRQQQAEHLSRWPVTLRKHGYRMWWLGIIGNWLLLYILQPFVMMQEYISQLFGKQPFNRDQTK